MRTKIKKVKQNNITTIESISNNNSWIASIKRNRKKRIQVKVNSISSLFNRSSNYFISNKTLDDE